MPLPSVLDRFLQAQEPVWLRVQAELTAGEKRTHWMWFVFPQLQGLGHSAMAHRYAIASLEEASAYIEHPILGLRLRQCCELLLKPTHSASALQIFGSPDNLKLQSSMTLFALASPSDECFGQVLDRFYGGVRDQRTLELLR